MTLIIPWSRPFKAKLAIEALSSRTRLNIIKILLGSRRGLTAQEISRKLGLSLPTTLEHLEILVSSGIIQREWRVVGRRVLKAYRLVDSQLDLKIDLLSFVETPEKRELEELAHLFVDKVREIKELDARPLLETIQKVLKVDRAKALSVLDYILSSEEEIVDHLALHTRTIIADIDTIPVR
ncbi:MAG TPA: ArsR family transcriptional regulator [Thermoprotei archaeon]|nr:ArsR family transcriptional regulator [Thermoprotei archaeon]